MIDGGYITGRLYAPKELWHQPEMEMLPDLDKKLALAEYLLSVLKSTRHDPLDPALTMQELHRLETALYVNPSDVGNTATVAYTGNTSNNVSSTVASSIKSTMGSMQHWRASWKWSKRPVEIIRNERSIDDRYPMYIRTLIKLFSTAQFLDGWYSEYSDLVAVSPASTVDIYQRILCKISMCAEALGRIVCTTVLGDFQVIWGAYMARNNRWIHDDL
ncbi:hypothetical protein K492DRAFT_240507 [Lichtheimia hyalospora FSU 10163]|nr:hypothetical protein K492DRAFT_240507 [Lichtheimia hyalospora FSU 10163]